MRRHVGTITLVQEHRFQLTDEAGGRHQCVLSSSCPVEWEALYALYQRGASVEIHCSSSEGILAETVHAIAADEEDVRPVKTTHSMHRAAEARSPARSNPA